MTKFTNQISLLRALQEAYQFSGSSIRVISSLVFIADRSSERHPDKITNRGSVLTNIVGEDWNIDGTEVAILHLR